MLLIKEILKIYDTEKIESKRTKKDVPWKH